MNNLPPDTSRLPFWPFLVTDFFLLSAAGLIAWQAESPLGVATLATISGLVGLGAVVTLYPLVINYTRRQDAAMQAQADQMTALARTFATSAEQLSIAAANLPAIAEQAARQLKIAEQLPAELQARLSALHSQLAATSNEENAALRHQLDTLRAAETDKLGVALAGLARATADLDRLELLAAKHSAALDTALVQLPKIAETFGQQAAETLRRETTAATTTLHASATAAGGALATAAEAASASITEAARLSAATLAEASTQARLAFEQGVQDAITHFDARITLPPPPPPHTQTQAQATLPDTPIPDATPTAIEELIAPDDAPALDDHDLDEPASEPEPEPELSPEPVAELEPEPEPLAEPEPEIESAPEESEPEPSAVETAVEEEIQLEPSPEPILEPTTEPAPEPETEPVAAAIAEPEVSPEPEPAPEPETEPVAEPTIEASPESAPEPEPEPEPTPEPALSHDGCTRLVASAFIGIGNKLYIRGDGPGLRRDKGVPLQFVSIGKWRWESAELLFPATVRLYKNDQIECAALGELTLEPGHHHEVNATF